MNYSIKMIGIQISIRGQYCVTSDIFLQFETDWIFLDKYLSPLTVLYQQYIIEYILPFSMTFLLSWLFCFDVLFLGTSSSHHNILTQWWWSRTALSASGQNLERDANLQDWQRWMSLLSAVVTSKVGDSLLDVNKVLLDRQLSRRPWSHGMKFHFFNPA